MTDLLDLIEAMGSHFHEHQADILAWSWPMFCAKWRRLVIAAAQDRYRQTAHKREQHDEEAKQGLRDAMAQMTGG